MPVMENFSSFFDISVFSLSFFLMIIALESWWSANSKKIQNNIDVFRHSSSSLAVTTSAIIPIKVSIKSFTPVEVN